MDGGGGTEEEEKEAEEEEAYLRWRRGAERDGGFIFFDCGIYGQDVLRSIASPCF